MFEAAGVMEASLRERARLADCVAPLSPGDLTDWAELAVDAGHADAARLLYQVAAITQGFSRQLRRQIDAIGKGSGLWAVDAVETPQRPSANIVDVAIADLKDFATAFATRPPRPVEHHVADSIEAAAHRIHATASLKGSSGTMAEAVAVLFEALRAPGAKADDTIDAAIATLRESVVGAADAYRAMAGAPLPLLASALAASALNGFLATDRDILAGDNLSGALFHRVARFDSFGLGPYFCNVAQVARRSRDLVELAAIGFETAQAAGDGADPDFWIALLARRIDGPLFDELIDDLGDRAMSAALGRILDRLAGASPLALDLPRIMRIRDAALDNLDYPLASRAQSIVAQKAETALEWLILGTIDGSAGRTAAAEQSFRRCLVLTPDDQGVRDRIAALGSPAFSGYAISRGFGTPEDRQLGRLWRREGRDLAAQKERPSTLGVQVNY